jgi:hypothetical protein
MKIKLHPFQNSDLTGGKCSVAYSSYFILREKVPGTNWI